MAEELTRICGKSIKLIEAHDKVSGRYKYVDDIPSELFGKILRSPFPHARIKNIDIRKAEVLEGVESILTHKDVANRLMPRACAKPCLVLEDRVRYVGDEVAAVAAKSKALAEEALDLIEVDYELLPSVFDPEEAVKSNAPKLYPEGNVYPTLRHKVAGKRIDATVVLEWGDIEFGFRDADVFVEEKFEIKPYLHTPLETHVCIASWRGDELIIRVATQVPYEVRSSLSYVLGIPQAKVRVISPAIGGGFGGKYTERYIAIAALLSKKAGGKSTKIVFTREEEQCHVKRGGCKVYVKIGAQRNGKITSILLRAYFDIGAYGNHNGGSAGLWGEAPVISYKAENARFEAWDIHTNHFSSQPLRSIHLPTLVFALEQVIDDVGEKLRLNPAEFRMKNMPETGEMMPPKPYIVSRYDRAKLHTYPAKRLMREVVDKAGFHQWKEWGKPKTIVGTKRRGIGLAYSIGWGGYFWEGFMSMTVVIHPDGSVQILSGAQDIGTGLNTSLSMLAAESLGISLEEVNILSGDTNSGQYDFYGARSSRSLTTGGHLLLCAVESAKGKIQKIAALKLKVESEEVEVYGKKAYLKGDKNVGFQLSEFLTASITATASGTPGTVFGEVEPGVKICQPQIQVAEVEVDIETGEVKVLRIVTGNYPGKMINPAIVKGQYIGGAIQALGWALYEEFSYDEKNNAYLSCNLTDYKVPRATDIPTIENVILEEFSQQSPYKKLPYGAMGVGEMGCGTTMAAIANAIYNAIGVRMRKAPMTPEVILDAIRNKVH